ncbi:hypothetical protein HYH03_007325 [Edaphochlamys debaryana]|uniref:Importin subunit alpha n=1 Tax=Edaphochlamys debaryana TaxID=47281 RepID=A0A835Y4G9_9CHLO|nr:hypothetical protein HYH03_007325 [Edaphochlamys debaryana]|eukprot:KAG2494558.1 hypothetical protein HYH03_007325 [Edaphochlamys debaryana]
MVVGPNPSCPSYKAWRGVSAHNARRAREESTSPRFLSKQMVVVPEDLRGVLLRFNPPASPTGAPEDPAPADATKPWDAGSGPATAAAGASSAAAPPLAKESTGGSSRGSSTGGRPDLDKALADLVGGDEATWLAATTAVRKALSAPAPANEGAIGAVIDRGALPRLIQLLDRADKPQLRLEATWALCNMAAGTSEQCRAVVRAGVLPPAIKLLESGDAELRDQAAWLLGNIAGDEADVRDEVVKAGAVPPLLAAIRAETSAGALKQQIWFLGNIVRKKGCDRAVMRSILPTLAYLGAAAAGRAGLDSEAGSAVSDRASACAATVLGNDTVVGDLMWAASYAADELVEALVEAAPDLVRAAAAVVNAAAPSPEALMPAIRLLGNLASGEKEATQAVIDSGVLTGGYTALLSRGSVRASIQKEVAWTLSNIAAGTADQARAVEEAGLLPVLVRLYDLQGDPSVHAEASFALAGLASTHEDLAIEVLEAGGVAPLSKFLRTYWGKAAAKGKGRPSDASATAAAEGLYVIAKAASKGGSLVGRANPALAAFLRAGVYRSIEEVADEGALPDQAAKWVAKILREYKEPPKEGEEGEDEEAQAEDPAAAEAEATDEEEGGELPPPASTFVKPEGGDEGGGASTGEGPGEGPEEVDGGGGGDSAGAGAGVGTGEASGEGAEPTGEDA